MQFDVYANPNPRTRDAMPLLLEVQSDLLRDLASCVVVPLSRTDTGHLPELRTLTPRIQVEGSSYLLQTPQLAGVARKPLGKPLANLSAARGEIMAALDLLLTGY